MYSCRKVMVNLTVFISVVVRSRDPSSTFKTDIWLKNQTVIQMFQIHTSGIPRISRARGQSLFRRPHPALRGNIDAKYELGVEASKDDSIPAYI